MIVDSILNQLSSYLLDANVEILDYCVCARYAYCLVGNKNKRALGLALVMHPDIFSERIAIRPSLDNLIEGFIEGGILTRTLFLSYINAISQYILWQKNCENIHIFSHNLIDYITNHVEENPKIVVICNMKPLVKKLLDRGYEKVFVFERDPSCVGKKPYQNTSNLGILEMRTSQ